MTAPCGLAQLRDYAAIGDGRCAARRARRLGGLAGLAGPGLAKSVRLVLDASAATGFSSRRAVHRLAGRTLPRVRMVWGGQDWRVVL